jgi:uncharacterized protein
MIINVHRIRPEGTLFEGEEPPDTLVLDEENDLVRIAGPLAYRFTAEVVSRELVLRGELEARAELACSRCAVFFSTTLTDSSFLRAYDLPEGADEVDVTDDLREAILLQLPNFPICSAACKGLCPQCGKNLNEGPCGCEQPREDDRWSSLDGLNPDG